ncbi:HlyD family secretion protein [Legionella sp.]|uniref:HlyD family secretion protein n=1 Tax=Legionella sp. TaxID=459 RepID=UPI003C927A9D
MRQLIFICLVTVFLISCKHENKSFNGYIDTDLVYLSADFSGRLVDLAVFKGQLVNANQFLFKLEQTSEQYDVAKSKLNQKDLLAQRQQAIIQLNYNKINYHRNLTMRQHNAASQGDLDAALRDLDSAKQQVASLDFKIESNQFDTKEKKWRIERKENYAPSTGIIFDTYYTKGEFVQTGYPVLSLITKDNVKAIFFVPQQELSRIRLNEKIKVKVDQDSLYAMGHIFYISNIAEFTPPIIYSREERQRLVFRIEAKIDSPDLEKLHLGQPVTLELVS